MISRFSQTILRQQGDYRAHYINRFCDLRLSRAIQVTTVNQKSNKIAKFEKKKKKNHHAFRTTSKITFTVAPVKVTFSVSDEDISLIYNATLVKFRDLLRKMCILLPC